MESCLGHKDLLCDADIPIEMFDLVTIDMISRREPKMFPNVRLTSMPAHYLIIQHKFVERLSFAMDELAGRVQVKLMWVGEFSLPSVAVINDTREQCVIL